MSDRTPWIIDAHLDLSLSHRRYGRDLASPLERIRAGAGEPQERGGTATVSLPAMRAGGVGITFATILALTRPADHPHPLTECETQTPEQAKDTVVRDLAFYRRLEAQGHARLLLNRSDLDSHVNAWNSGRDERRLGIVPLMEGAEPILTPSELPWWWDQGLRILSLAWFGTNRYAHGTGTPGGLTELGRELVAAMASTRLILDVSHLAENACHEALDSFGGPVMASHSNARALVPGDRQLADDVITELGRRNGVIGMALHCGMLAPGWQRGDSHAGIRLATVADHVDHICQVTGDFRHVGIGSDLDGGFGREQSPADLDSIADLQKLLAVLSDRGYSDEAIMAIAHGNWLRILCNAWS